MATDQNFAIPHKPRNTGGYPVRSQKRKEKPVFVPKKDAPVFVNQYCSCAQKLRLLHWDEVRSMLVCDDPTCAYWRQPRHSNWLFGKDDGIYRLSEA